LSILAEIVQVRKTESVRIEQNKPADSKPNQLEVIDPVCGMSVEPSQAKYSSEYRRETYYFCCAGCKQEFDVHPENYLAASLPSP
jgi:YHS domain-containing protein